MNDSAQQQSRLRDAFPQFGKDQLESIAQYLDVALEIATQDLIDGKTGFDIVPPNPILKERSNSNLKDQS
jgi:hypothetical protein